MERRWHEKNLYDYYEESQCKERLGSCAKYRIYLKHLSIQNLFCQLLSIDSIIILEALS